VSAHKEAVVLLKNALLQYGISGFVAHEDMSQTWNGKMRLNSRSARCTLSAPYLRQTFIRVIGQTKRLGLLLAECSGSSLRLGVSRTDSWGRTKACEAI